MTTDQSQPYATAISKLPAVLGVVGLAVVFYGMRQLGFSPKTAATATTLAFVATTLSSAGWLACMHFDVFNDGVSG